MSEQFIFVSYSHNDRDWLEKLRPNLESVAKAHDALEVWVDEGKLRCGDTFDDKIVEAIDQSLVAVLLLSPHFFSSDYIMKHELPALLRRYESEDLKILPFLLRPCRWEKAEWAHKLYIYPDNATPATKIKARDLDDHFYQLASEIEDVFLDQMSVLDEDDAGEGATDRIERVASTGGNLPKLHDGFFGREREVTELSSRLDAAGPARLLTLLGTAGLGKTRLAKEVGKRLEPSFPGGVWFVDLTPATSVTGICHEIWGTLGQPLASSQASPVEVTAGLISSLPDALIILDNFEQVANLADETVGVWLQRIPGVRFLVTSRLPLDIDGESCVSIEPLSIPDPGAGDRKNRENACVQLFLDRYARIDEAASPGDLDLSEVAGICRDLEGIPLSIELAVALLEILSLSQLKTNLQRTLLLPADPDGPVKKPSLAAALHTSLDLLSPDELQSFLRLSVFRDGFDLDAAEALLDPDRCREQPVFYTLLKLNKHSLLRCRDFLGEKRYFFFVSVREFAHQLWQKEVDDDEMRRVVERWSRYYVRWAQQISKDLGTRKASKALDRLSAEFENLLGVQEEALANGDAILAARAILLLTPLMSVRGPAPLRVPKILNSLRAIEARYDLEASPDQEVKELYCQLKTELSKAYWSQGQWNEAEEAAEDAALLATDELDDVVRAKALLQQARMLVDRGFLRSGLASIEAAETMLDEETEASLIATAEIARGSVLERLGDLSRAQRSFRRAEELAVALGDRFQAAMVHNRRGIALWHHGHLDDALNSLLRAEQASRNLESRAWVGAHTTNQGLVLGDMERFDEAIARFRAGERSHQELGYRHWEAINSGGWGRTLMMRDQPGDREAAIDKIEMAETMAREVYYPEDIALHMGDLARLYSKAESWVVARRASREAVALERRMGAVLDHRHFCNLVTHAASALRLGIMDEAWDALISARDLYDHLDPASQQLRKVVSDRRLQAELTRAFDTEFPDRRESLSAPAQIADLDLPAETAVDLHRQIARAPEIKGFEYPWRGLERFLEKQDADSILLFAYGSLLNHGSASETIRDHIVELHQRAIAFGAVRLLDYDMPPAVASRSVYRGHSQGQDRALFNLRFTGFVSDASNGILITVPKDEIQSLREREIGYDLRPLVCLPWGDLRAEPRIAYGLGCSGRQWQGHKLTRSELMPHPAYYDLCKEGAATLGDEFLDYFLDTSFLADGETTARDWEAGRS